MGLKIGGLKMKSECSQSIGLQYHHSQIPNYLLGSTAINIEQVRICKSSRRSDTPARDLGQDVYQLWFANSRRSDTPQDCPQQAPRMLWFANSRRSDTPGTPAQLNLGASLWFANSRRSDTPYPAQATKTMSCGLRTVVALIHQS